MRELTLAYSPCPNDTYIFHAMAHGLVNWADNRFITYLADVEELNRRAFTSDFDVTKVSAAAYLKLKDRYTLLKSGAAIGFGCGPILVKGKSPLPLEEMRIAVPGQNTTAAMLMRLWNKDLAEPVAVRFDHIIPLVERGEFDAGLIIHEGRFVYQNSGLTKIVDLGEWWEKYTGLPIPLGVIAAASDRFSSEETEDIGRLVRSSIEYAVNHPHESEEYIKSHAQELNADITASHISLYVNDFSIDMGAAGMKALDALENEAVKKSLL